MGSWFPPEPRVPPRWLLHQQFSFAAARHSKNEASGEREQHELFSFLWPKALVPTGEAFENYRRMLLTLPPSVLDLICSLEERQVDYWADHQEVWRKERRQLEWDDALHRSRWAGAKLVADRLMDGLFAPSQIRRLFRTELKTDLSAQFDARLATLAAAFASARSGYDRLDAVSDFSEHRPPNLWALVENAILQHSLAWPLLMLDGDVPCALPALVTVLLPDEPGGIPLGKRVAVIDGPKTHGQEWESSLEKARIAAIELWETKHACQDPAFQEAVRHARVLLDLRLASRVVEKSCPNGRLRLWGPSLETYIGLEVLSQLLGSRGLGSTCATGEIGDRHANGTEGYVQEGAFYGVEAVDDVEDKVECVRRAFHFDKVIFPAETLDSGSLGHLQLVAIEGQIDEHSFGKSDRGFSGFATEALGQRWRRHRYVRCPDIAAVFKKDWNGPSPGPSGVLKLFSGTSAPVVRVSGYRPAAVAQALYWVNRHADESKDERFAGSSGNQRLGRFAFVRAVPGEEDERFWAVVWDVCGGSRASFRRFVLASSLRAAAEELAAMLNKVTATADHRVAAPDVLVIFGVKHLAPAGPQPRKSDPFARFRLDLLADELLQADLLRQCRNEALRAHLGAKRLILVTDDEPPRRQLIHYPEEPLGKAMEWLSIFRNGFTFPMAKNLLGLDDDRCWELLNALRYRTPRLLDLAENSQEFFLKRSPHLPDDPNQRAELHRRAANAIVGILSRTHRPAHHDFASSLRPEWIHEAQWHAEQAFALRASESDARERLNRIGEPFTWSQLRWAACHSIHAGPDMGRAALAALDETDPPGAHPIQLAWLAMFARRIEGQDPGSAQQWAAERARLFDQALVACAGLRDSIAAEFTVRTARSGICMEGIRSGAVVESVRNDIVRAWQLYGELEAEDGAGVIEIFDRRWFEWCADAEHQLALSIRRYRAGFLNPRVRGTQFLEIAPFVKWLGCRQMTGRPLSPFEWRSLEPSLRPWHIEEIWANPDHQPGLAVSNRSARRWQAGRALLFSKLRV